MRVRLEGLGTEPKLADLLLQLLQRVLRGGHFEDIEDTGYQDLYIVQERIGFHHLLKGRFCNLWGKYQQQHLGDQVTTEKNGTAWTAAVATTIMKCWLGLWDIRNGERHGKDVASQTKADKEQAIREVEMLYEIKEHIPRRLQFIYHHPLATLKEKQAGYLIAWINDYKTVLERAYSEELNTG